MKTMPTLPMACRSSANKSSASTRSPVGGPSIRRTISCRRCHLHVYLAARHVALSDELRAYVDEPLVQPNRNHNGLTIIRTEVQLYNEGPRGACHVLVGIKGHHDINKRELQDTLFAAI